MQHAQLNADNTLSRIIDHDADVVWDATHQCPASRLTHEEAAYFRVVGFTRSASPAHDPMTQGTREAAPLLIEGALVQQWEIYPLPDEEVADKRIAAAAALQSQIVAKTQARLDAFAHTRHYDGILSACTYAGSTIPKFASEGQAAVHARDATWAALYAVLAEVQSGKRPMPGGFADIEPLLPVLTWES